LTVLALCGLRPNHWILLAGVALLWSVGTRMLLALAVSRSVVKERSAAQSVLLYPVRDLLGLMFWLTSYVSRKVLWRNEIYRLESGGRMRRVHR
jgi:ceramide glucosyltransferase